MTDNDKKNRDELVSLLNLVPYFSQHPDRTLMEAAQDLGRSPETLQAQLLRLHTSGVGKYTDQMFDLEVDWRKVRIFDNQGLTQPLQLTPVEAGSFLLILESLENYPGLLDRSAVESASAKLRTIMDDRTQAVYDAIADPDLEESETQRIVAEALSQHKQLKFRYYSASSGSFSERVVEPVSIFVRDREIYLEAVDLDKNDYRTFRLDRIEDAEILPVEARQHPSHSGDGFELSNTAKIRLHVEAAWLVNYEPIDLAPDVAQQIAQGEEWVEAQLHYGTEEWLIRFCLGQADRVQLVSPASAAREVRHRAKIAIKRYTEQTD